MMAGSHSKHYKVETQWQKSSSLMKTAAFNKHHQDSGHYS